MDSPIRLGVASLVRQRGAGDISRDTFFERLAALQTGTAPADGANDSLMGLGPVDTSVSGKGLWQPGGPTHPALFDSSLYFDDMPHGHDFGEEDFHAWSEGPPLLTSEAARALILGTSSKPSSGPSRQSALHVYAQPESAWSALAQAAGAYDSSEAPLPPTGMAWLAEPERLAPEGWAALDDPSMAWPTEPELYPSRIQEVGMAYDPEGWDALEDVRSDNVGDLHARAFSSNRWSPNGLASSPLGQEALGLGIGAGYLPFAPPLPGSSPLVSPPASPAQASPRSDSASLLQESDGFRISRGVSDSPHSSFAQRSELWEMQRARRCQELRYQRDARESAECSFRPNSAGLAATQSVSSVRPRRSNGNAAWTGQGHPGSSSRESSAGGLTSNAAAALADRLSRPNPGADRDALKWRARRESEEMQECTFRPDVSKSSKSCRLRASSAAASLTPSDAACWEGDLGSRSGDFGYRAGGATASGGKRSAPKLFAPVTNPVPPEMVNARAYLSEHVFSRLTQPSPEVLAASVAEASYGVGKPALQKSASGGIASGLGFGEKVSDVSTMSRCRSSSGLADETLVSFLQRQNSCEESRRKRLDSIKLATANPLQPELCSRSVQLATRHRARCQQKLVEGGESSGAHREPVPEPECSFRPRITAAAKQRERRSLSDLSVGDQRRREAKIARQRDELRAKEMKDVSFAPKIQQLDDVQSRLRVLQDPNSYLERLAKSKSSQNAKFEQERKKRLEKEAEEFTFKPKVNGQAPDFVQRMAESYRLVRDLKEKENQSFDQCTGSDSKPDWR